MSTIYSTSNSETILYKTLSFLGFPKYRVGTDGSLWWWSKMRGWKKRTLKPDKWYGYIRVSLYTKKTGAVRFYLHNIILRAFIGEPPSPVHQTRHLDGVKTNNKLTNLKWGTPKENGQDKVDHGNSLKGDKHPYHNGTPPMRGEKNGMAKLTEKQVIEIRRLHATGKYTQLEIGKMFGLSQPKISSLVRRKLWKHI